MPTCTVLQFDDDAELPVVHHVDHHLLPDLLGGDDAAAWLLTFGWFGRRWVLVDHLGRSGAVTRHDTGPAQDLGLSTGAE